MIYYYGIKNNRISFYKSDGIRTFKYFYDFSCWMSFGLDISKITNKTRIDRKILNDLSSSKFIDNLYIKDHVLAEIIMQLDLIESGLGQQIL